MAPVLRFAPSPNGCLHLGHVYSAAFSYRLARRLRGRFLLRIEDIDTPRCREDHVQAIFEDLAWLGLSWEEPVRRQSRHFADYRAGAEKLRALGVLYPCFATRAEIVRAAAERPRARDPDGAPLYPGLYRDFPPDEAARRIAAGESCALRLHMDKALALARDILDGQPLDFEERGEEDRPRRVPAHPEAWGDAVIVRKDVPASYHLAAVTDDALQGITHVSRGRDLFAATGLHRLLQVLLGLPQPVYIHHRLVTDAGGRKLSKSAGDQSVRELRAHGATPAEILSLAGCRI